MTQWLLSSHFIVYSLDNLFLKYKRNATFSGTFICLNIHVNEICGISHYIEYVYTKLLIKLLGDVLSLWLSCCDRLFHVWILSAWLSLIMFGNYKCEYLIYFPKDTNILRHNLRSSLYRTNKYPPPPEFFLKYSTVAYAVRL